MTKKYLLLALLLITSNLALADRDWSKTFPQIKSSDTITTLAKFCPNESYVMLNSVQHFPD